MVIRLLFSLELLLTHTFSLPRLSCLWIFLVKSLGLPFGLVLSAILSWSVLLLQNNKKIRQKQNITRELQDHWVFGFRSQAIVASTTLVLCWASKLFLIYFITCSYVFIFFFLKLLQHVTNHPGAALEPGEWPSAWPRAWPQHAPVVAAKPSEQLQHPKFPAAKPSQAKPLLDGKWQRWTLTAEFVFSSAVGGGVAPWPRQRLTSLPPWPTCRSSSWAALWSNVPPPTWASSGQAGLWRQPSKLRSSMIWQVMLGGRELEPEREFVSRLCTD